MTDPDRAYFGEKDYQQIAVIKRMKDDLKFRVEIISCPVIRETNGLAMSSRNTLLTPGEKEIASNIYRILKESKTLGLSVAKTQEWVVKNINDIDGLDVEYFSIVDGDTLADISDWQQASNVVGCITVYCGKTPIRLIDHIRYK
jgi:pantoate--beta-alanine ligase